jgi:hypothetical protein
MTKKVFSITDRSISNTLWICEHLLPKNLFSFFFETFKNNHILKLLKKVKARGPRQVTQIERVKNISPDVFYNNFFKKNIPVVLEGAALGWDCSKWDFDFFKENYGEEKTMITDHGDMKLATLSDVIDELRATGLSKARVCNVIQNNQQLMDEVDNEFLKNLIPKSSFTTSYQFFLGVGGNATPMHAGMTNNFSIQLLGEKTWNLVSPEFNPLIKPIIDGGPLLKSSLSLLEKDFQEDERIQAIDVMTTELKAGDILFNPSFYWHHIEYNSESITIGLRWLNLYSTLKSSITMAALVGLAYNPSAFISFLTIRKGKEMPFYR